METTQINDVIYCTRTKGYGIVQSIENDLIEFTPLIVNAQLIMSSNDSVFVTRNTIHPAGEELTKNPAFVKFMETRQKPDTNQTKARHEPHTSQTQTRHEPLKNQMQHVRSFIQKPPTDTIDNERLKVIELLQTKEFYTDLAIKSFSQLLEYIKNATLPRYIEKKVNATLGTSYTRITITNIIEQYSRAEKEIERKEQKQQQANVETQRTQRRKIYNRLSLIAVLLFLWLTTAIIKALIFKI